MSLTSYLRAAPKVELHVHLEGAILPETLLALAQRNGVALPAEDVAGLREWFTFRDFPHFVKIFYLITTCLRTAQDYEDIAYQFGAEMGRQHVRYAEVTFTPSTQYSRGIPQDAWFGGLTRGRERARADFGVEIAWVFDIVRYLSDASQVHPLADYTTAVAIEGMRDGVIALGLGGLEAGHPPEPFAPYFTRARAAGLRSAPHSGETAGPESIWGAIRTLGAERIGHGVRAIEDPALVRYLADEHLPLEVNPTSNLRLGIYPSLAEHPLRRLRDAGVTIAVGSDDPPLFNTTLSDEVALLGEPFAFDVAACDAILLDAVRSSFLPAERKAALLARCEVDLAALKAEHLGSGQ
jgi:aminodeoxyfutalosine deaminase